MVLKDSIMHSMISIGIIMACFGSFERDPHKWERCRKTITIEMLNNGWNKHAGKFNEVMMRKAIKLYNKTK